MKLKHLNGLPPPTPPGKKKKKKKKNCNILLIDHILNFKGIH